MLTASAKDEYTFHWPVISSRRVPRRVAYECFLMCDARNAVEGLHRWSSGRLE